MSPSLSGAEHLVGTPRAQFRMHCSALVWAVLWLVPLLPPHFSWPPEVPAPRS